MTTTTTPQDSPSNPNFRVTTLSSRSLINSILQPVIRPFRPRLVKPGKPLPAGSPKLSPSSTKARVVERQVEDIYLYDFYPSDSIHTHSRPKSHRLFYFAGGGFQSPPSKEHWKLCAELCRQLSSTYAITLVSYPLAPHSPATHSLPALQSLFTTIFATARADGASVTLAGDSAGGNVALSLALWDASVMVTEGREKTRALKNVLVVSPPCDMRNINPAISDADRHDPILTVGMIESVAANWAAELPRDDPRISPVFGDVAALKRTGVRVHGVVGTYDVLAPDALAFKDLCEKHGVPGDWLVWEKQMHCFPLAFAYGLPEGKRGVKWIVDTLKNNA